MSYVSASENDRVYFWAFYRKNDIKTSIFRDLLLEGAILIVGTNSKLATNDFYKDVYDNQMFCVSMKCI